MAITIVNSELTVGWEYGAQIGYVDALAADESQGGYVDPVGLQARPLMQATFSTIDVALVRAMYGTTRSGRRAFFVRPPLDAFKKMTAVSIGTGTGSSQNLQLIITLGTLSWNALYPVDGTITIYSNGVATTQGVNWTLGALGVITGTFTNGNAITATFEYKTPVRFLDPELQETIETVNYEIMQTVTIREIFPE